MSRRENNSRAARRNSRSRKIFRARIIFTVLVLVVLGIIAAGIILLLRYRTYSGYYVTSSIEMSNSEENTVYYEYRGGYLKCAGDGIIYFNKDGIIWSESYSMMQPVIDICGDYIAVADMGQMNVYLYDKGGFINRINLSHSITGLEVSEFGVIAVASGEGNINYIEIRDRNGYEIMTEKSIFSSSGYLMDISLSDDGTRLAAVFVSVDKGTLRSKVVFYDLSGFGSGADIITGIFDQYESVLLTSVHFMDNDIVCAAGDTALSLYRFREEPALVYEMEDMDWETQALFFSDRYIGMVVEEAESESKYYIKVFDTEGKLRMNLGTDFSFNKADFAGNNVILYNGNELLMYSLAAIEKIYYSFDKHIEAIKSSDGRNFVYGINLETRFITLR